MEEFFNELTVMLKRKFLNLLQCSCCHIETAKFDVRRNHGSPLWINGIVDNEILACEISDSPMEDFSALEVCFFWRRGNDHPIAELPKPYPPEGTTFNYWNDQQKPFPKGFLPADYGNGWRLAKVYNRFATTPREVAREIREIYRLFGL
ncbi:MAG: hypothetical protein IKM62_00895 [Kiritimatiellae bacterium]|nr:hypothetical protein [Kiritimatiellia bacterium]